MAKKKLNLEKLKMDLNDLITHPAALCAIDKKPETYERRLNYISARVRDILEDVEIVENSK